MVRDHKQRMPVQMSEKEEIVELLLKEEELYEEKFNNSSQQSSCSKLRKSLILDDFDKLKPTPAP